MLRIYWLALLVPGPAGPVYSEDNTGAVRRMGLGQILVLTDLFFRRVRFPVVAWRRSVD